VFTIVIADILQERFALSATLYGALMVFAVVKITVPGCIPRVAHLNSTHQVPRMQAEGGHPKREAR
jgi:hypothetical protein